MKDQYENPASTVDLILEGKDKEIGKLLFIKRKHAPFRGYWSLPGGFLNYGKENLEQAAVRELKEETGLIFKLDNLKLMRVYSDPNRDPRGHVISHVYHARNYEGILKANDDAEDADFLYPEKNMKLAFDHREILNDYYEERNGAKDYINC